MSDKQNEKVARAMADIDAMELSDVEEPGFSDEKEHFQVRSLKRALEVENIEAGKRKVRRTTCLYYACSRYLTDLVHTAPTRRFHQKDV